MSIRHRTISFLVTFSLALAAPVPAAAQDWFAGVSLGAQQKRFSPYYTVFDGEPPSQFENRVTGLDVAFLAGRRARLNDRLSMALQGSVGVNRFEWTLSIPEEPAELRYALPIAIVGSVLPDVRVAGAVSLFAEIGAGTGRVREIKTAPTTSTYDQELWRPVLATGGGVRVEAAPRVDVIAQYRYMRYGEFEYDTFTRTGQLVEHVRDTPWRHGVYVGVVGRF